MATTIGKAYVQIVPTAQGIEGSITNLLGGETASAGSASGESFGSNMLSKIKTIIAAAGIGQIFKQAIEEGANLEQSIGGIETLFGESADLMKEYASEAYKTAGLSANDYMEQATSFAASLLQGTGGDTQKAAETANTALIDMADNANKMGTSIESIQNAYQGFAKQNYTMLDNLKLGYGGTKTEMERLLADAQKITGVKYDISNLNDVYSAIHVIQGEMGITGTTAEEAASTISGSLSQMKASFSNLLASLTLGEDVSGPLQSLVSSVSTFLVDNLIPAVINIISALPQTIGTLVISFVPTLHEQVQTLIDGFTNYIDSNLGTFIDEGIKVLDSMVTGIIDDIPNLIESASRLTNTFLETISSRLPEILSKGFEILQNVVNGIFNNFPALVNAVTQAVMTFIQTISNNLPSILAKGVEMLQSIVTGIINNLPQIIASAIQIIATLVSAIAQNLPQIIASGVTIITDLATSLIDTLPTLWENFKTEFGNIDWASLGSNIIQGIKNGIENGIDIIVDAAKNAASAAFEAAKEFLGIASPSKKFKWVGEMSDEGLAKGLTENVGLISDAMDDVTSEMLNPLDTDMAVSSYGVNVGKSGKNSNNNSGYTQIINNYSPKALSASEVARQTRNSTKQMALRLSMGG